MAVALFSLSVLLTVSLVSATDYTWVGGNMRFSDPLNWQFGMAPSNSTMGDCFATRFGSSTKTIVSQLDASTYFVGRVLYLPRNGVLRLATDGTVIAFSEPARQSNATCTSNNTQVYTWSGGLTQEVRNNFYCHLNWKDLSTDTIAEEAPCASTGDTMTFDGSLSYATFLPSNVSLLAVSKVTLGSVSVSSATSLNSLLPQIDFSNDLTATLFIGTAVAAKPFCRAELQFDPTKNSACVCFSSCPTAAMLARANSVVTVNQVAAAQSIIAQNNINVTKSFFGYFPAGFYPITASELQAVNSTQKMLLQSSIQTALMTLPAWRVSITNFQLNMDGSIAINGTLVATASALFPPGGSAVPSSINWVASGSVSSPNVNSSRLQLLVQASAAPILISFVALQQAAQLNSNIPTDPQLANYTLQLSAIPNASTATNIADSNDCFSQCVFNCSDCLAALNESLVAAGYSVSNAASIAQSLISAKSYAQSNNITWEDVSSQIAAVANITQQLSSVSQAGQALTPVAVSQNSPTFYFGRSRSLADQLAAVSTANSAALVESFKSLLAKFPQLSSISNFALGWVATLPSSRRRGLPQSPSAITVSFSYSIMCSPSDTVCLSLMSPGGALYLAVSAGLDATFSATSLSLFPPCYVAPSTITPAQFSWACLTNLATSFCASLSTPLSSATSATYAYLYEVTRCGFLPRYPNGNCLDNSYNQTAFVMAANISASACVATTAAPTPATVAVTTTTTTTIANVAAASSSGGGGGGLGLAAAGAGGGGAVIIIIIIVVVMRRRKNASGSKRNSKTDDRTVVAFENPMYDDPTNAPSQQMYGSGSMGGDHEGLYDEPAFNGAKKSNPLYRSNENLDDDYAQNAGGAGYLDVSPNTARTEDAGYLEQAPASEDVGYLGQEDAQPNYDSASEPAYADRSAALEQPAYDNNTARENPYGDAKSPYYGEVDEIPDAE